MGSSSMSPTSPPLTTTWLRRWTQPWASSPLVLPSPRTLLSGRSWRSRTTPRKVSRPFPTIPRKWATLCAARKPFVCHFIIFCIILMHSISQTSLPIARPLLQSFDQNLEKGGHLQVLWVLRPLHQDDAQSYPSTWPADSLAVPHNWRCLPGGIRSFAWGACTSVKARFFSLFTSKTRALTRAEKPIWRFLPKELGRLVALYLSYVKSFEATITCVMYPDSAEAYETIMFVKYGEVHRWQVPRF